MGWFDEFKSKLDALDTQQFVELSKQSGLVLIPVSAQSAKSFKLPTPYSYQAAYDLGRITSHMIAWQESELVA